MDFTKNELVGAAIAENEHILIGMDAQALQSKQLEVEEELRRKIIEGDSNGILRLRNALGNLPDLIRAAEIRELREKIVKTNARLAEIGEEIEYVEGLRAEKAKVYQEKLETARLAAVEIQKKDLILNHLDNEKTSCFESRREMRSRLQDLIDTARKISN